MKTIIYIELAICFLLNALNIAVVIWRKHGEIRDLRDELEKRVH